MLEKIALIFNYSIIKTTIRYSTPILYAALGVLITQQANMLNVGVEGMMLSGAFTAIAVSYFTGNWFLALIAAIIVGIILAIIMAFAHLKYDADIIVVGVAINLLSLALTRFLLNNVLGASGFFRSPYIVPIPKVHFDFLTKNDVINTLFNNYSMFEIIGIMLVFIIWFLLFKTVWGLRVRSVGLFPQAAETAGINVYKLKFSTMIFSGLLGGMAGAHLSLGYSKLFVENMTGGKGLMGVAAMFFGGGDPIFTWVGCLIFGFTDSVGSRLQPYGLPSQFVLMFPYITTVLFLTLSMIRRIRRERIEKSSLK
ncbi:MAG: ABC transporter permease [Candidatus Humimicrobiia bacterium]